MKMLFPSVEETFFDLYTLGNNISLGEWKFYPLRDKENFKKSAVDIENINKRKASDYIIVAYNDRDCYLGYDKDILNNNIYVWSEWPEVDPVLMFKGIDEMIEIFSKLVDGKPYMAFTEKEIDR